jgi:hypothetical protein
VPSPVVARKSRVVRAERKRRSLRRRRRRREIFPGVRFVVLVLVLVVDDVFQILLFDRSLLLLLLLLLLEAFTIRNRRRSSAPSHSGVLVRNRRHLSARDYKVSLFLSLFLSLSLSLSLARVSTQLFSAILCKLFLVKPALSKILTRFSLSLLNHVFKGKKKEKRAALSSRVPAEWRAFSRESGCISLSLPVRRVIGHTPYV